MMNSSKLMSMFLYVLIPEGEVRFTVRRVPVLYMEQIGTVLKPRTLG